MIVSQIILKLDIEYIYLDLNNFGLIVKILGLDLLAILKVRIRIIIVFLLLSMIFDGMLDEWYGYGYDKNYLVEIISD